MIPTTKIKSFGLLLALVGALVMASGGIVLAQGTTQKTTPSQQNPAGTTTATQNAASGSIAPAATQGANGPIVYRGEDSSGIEQLFTIPPGGGTPTQLTTGTNTFLDQPAFSPDGTKIAYVATVDSISHFAQIFTIPSNGGTPTQVTNKTQGFVNNPTFSPDGTKIAYVADDDFSTTGRVQSIFTILSSGGTPTEIPIGLTATGGTLNFPQDPVFSPDGTKIAFSAPDGNSASRSNQIFWISSGGGPPIRVTNDNTQDGNFNPHFSPDGTEIVFDADHGGIGGRQLHVIPSDAIDGVSAQLTDANVNFVNFHPTFSPDGTLIAYSVNNFGTQIFTIPSGGGTPTQLTSDAPAVHDNPDWGVPFDFPNPPPPPHHHKHHHHKKHHHHGGGHHHGHKHHRG